MGINLSGRDIRVAKHFLDNPKIGSSGEQVGGKAMAEQVGIDIGFKTRARGVAFRVAKPVAASTFCRAPTGRFRPRCVFDTSFGRSSSR